MSNHKPSSTSHPITAPNPLTLAPRKPKPTTSKTDPTHTHRQRAPPKTKRTTLPPNPPRPRHPIPPLPASLSLSLPSTPTSIDTRSPKPTPAALAATRLQHLHATTTLCHALHARNRNQHRAQLWFKHLGLLRRQLARLLALEVELFELRYGFVNANSESGGDGVGGRQAQEVRRRFEREAEFQGEKERVERWVRECVVPAAWVGAGTVLGEGQFAGVGLVLMGVLADVRGLVGGTELGEGKGEGEDGRTGFQSRGRRVRERDDGMTGNRGTEDVGEVVQRRTAIGKGSRSGTQTPATPEDLMDVDVLTAEAGASKQEAKRESSPFAAFDDEDDTLPTPGLDVPANELKSLPATTRMPPAEVTEKTAKSRDKRKGSDKDRDKKVQSKKKKKGTGNAIDDLFSGFG